MECKGGCGIERFLGDGVAETNSIMEETLVRFSIAAAKAMTSLEKKPRGHLGCNDHILSVKTEC